MLDVLASSRLTETGPRNGTLSVSDDGREIGVVFWSATPDGIEYGRISFHPGFSEVAACVVEGSRGVVEAIALLSQSDPAIEDGVISIAYAIDCPVQIVAECEAVRATHGGWGVDLKNQPTTESPSSFVAQWGGGWGR